MLASIIVVDHLMVMDLSFGVRICDLVSEVGLDSHREGQDVSYEWRNRQGLTAR